MRSAGSPCLPPDDANPLSSVGATLAVVRGRGRAPPILRRTLYKPVIARARRARGERSERRQWRMKRGNRRSAACGRISEAISRKCPDWRPRQWPGIGWHDGGLERVAVVKIGAPVIRQRGNFVRRNRDIRTPLHCIPCHADRGALSANSGRKCPKNAVKTHGFEILCAAGLPSAWKPSATRTGRAGLSSCFRIVSAPTAAGRSRGPALAWRGGDGFCVYRARRCGHRPLHKFGDMPP